MKTTKVVITYGTFDLFHIGHLQLLERLCKLGSYLIVGVSTDEFNLIKGKKSIYSFEERSRIVGALECVDKVIPETSWEQKLPDITHYGADVFGIGNDWEGRFDHLKSQCEVVYLERTPSRSTTEVKRSLSSVKQDDIDKLKRALDDLSSVVKAIE